MNRKIAQKAILLSSLVFWISTVFAQTTINWSKTYGGNGSDRGHCIQQTSDGGYVVSGYTDTNNNGDVSGNHGGGDIWVLKLDNSGNLEWQKAYGGTGGEPFTEANSKIIQTSDGGYLVTGESTSNNGDLTENRGNLDLWVFKIDANGVLQWQKSLGGAMHEGAHSILQEADGGFILAGYTSSTDGDVVNNKGMSDGWLIKLSATGDLVWQKTMGGSWTDALFSIQNTSDGGYITAGYTLSNDGDIGTLNPDGFMGYADFWIAKLNSNAEIEWQSVIGGSGKDEAKCIIQTNDGGYVVAGETESANGDISESFGKRDWWVVKLNAEGAMEWEKSLGGSQRDEVRSIVASSDGSGFFMVGTTESADNDVTDNHGGKDIWLVKLDYSGNIILNKCFGGTSSEKGFSIIQSTDNQIVIAGQAHSKDGDIVDDPQGDDVWVFKLDGISTGIEDHLNLQISFYPNPVADVLFFSEHLETIEIYSISGHKLIQSSESSQIKVNSLSSGTYLLKAETVDGKILTQKIMKQ